MSVLDRSALVDSPLADLHAIASELSIDDYRRLRRPELIQAIIVKQGGDPADVDVDADVAAATRRSPARAGAEVAAAVAVAAPRVTPPPSPPPMPRPRRRRSMTTVKRRRCPSRVAGGRAPV
jgi:hypothetical protein